MRTLFSSIKIFQMDMLSLVMACLISSIFAKGVVEFLSNTSKKQDHYSASVSHSPTSEYDENDLSLSADHHLQSPIENHTISEGNQAFPLQQFKTIGNNAVVGEEVARNIFRSDHWYLDQSYKNTLPSRWGPTISIAHRKLII